jgi:RimJ/RimL family protein N-acetyltransferase
VRLFRREFEVIETARLILRPWREDDRDDLARMCADPNVMVDYPKPQSHAESDVRFARYQESFEKFGFCRWAVERRNDGRFLGYTGINPTWPDHPLAPNVEIGWRLIREAWGCGYASEAASASLRDGFARCKLSKVYSFTTSENFRSQAVMNRIGLAREAARDFLDQQGQRNIVFSASADWVAPS